MEFLNYFPRVAIPPKMTDIQFLETEIQNWKYSPQRLLQMIGERYYRGDHDILKRKREVIGADGNLEEVKNLPNNRIVDNQFSKMVDQKANYLLSKPITFESDNSEYDEELYTVFNNSFFNKLKNNGKWALWGGISWMYVYYDDKGELAFQRFKPYEVLPFWKDDEHTILDFAIRLYEVQGLEGQVPKIYEKVEIFNENGIDRYDLVNGRLIADTTKFHDDYFYIGEKGYNWTRIPLVAFKYNEFELPLIKKVKSLQDALNLMISDFNNNMQEDNRNTILVIKNYDGQDLGEFRRNLSTYSAVKVRTGEGANGGVETLNIDVNSQNYDLVLKTLKKAIIENAMGYDAKDDRIGGNANMLNIKSMYSDIDLDADNMESEFKVSLENLLFFVNAYLKDKGVNIPKGKLRITFNRDILINETEVLNTLVNLGIRLPNELLVGQVPFVNNVKKVMEMLKKEQKENDIYGLDQDQRITDEPVK